MSPYKSKISKIERTHIPQEKIKSRTTFVIIHIYHAGFMILFPHSIQRSDLPRIEIPRLSTSSANYVPSQSFQFRGARDPI